MSNTSNTNGNTSLADIKPFVNTNISSSINQTESTLNHEQTSVLPTSNSGNNLTNGGGGTGSNTSTTNLGINNSLDTTGALTNDFNRASNSTLMTLAAINSGLNSFYPTLHSDTYG